MAAVRTNQTPLPRAGLLAASLAFVVAACVGCAIPPDIHERADAISAPSIDRTLVTPSPDQLVEITSTVTEFSVAGAITNTDPNEPLYFQWFVGYPESPTPLPPVFESQETIQFNACAFEDALSPAGSTHTIELFISEEPVEFDTTNGRTVPESYIYVSWAVQMKVACP